MMIYHQFQSEIANKKPSQTVRLRGQIIREDIGRIPRWQTGRRGIYHMLY